MNRRIYMSQDVLDRFNQSFYPKDSSRTEPISDASKLHVENGPLDIVLMAGTGNIKIEGEITEKELIQIASFF